jgi:AraC-like DNA-binding protein
MEAGGQGVDDLVLPSPRLKSFVEAYWQRRGSFESEKKVRVAADACTKIIFEVAPMPWPSCYVVGTQLAPIIVVMAGQVDRIGIRFRPGMAGFFLNRSLDGLSSRLTSFALLPVAEGEQIRSRLAAHASVGDRVAILEPWLLSRLSSRRSNLRDMRETARLNRGFRRGLSPSELAATMGWQERQLQRICRERFGATAAKLHRLHRFQAVLARLHGPPADLADIAAEFRFSDQAHMAREFRHFAGTTISSFLRQRALVGNIQDDGDWLPVLRTAQENGEW